MRIFAKKSDKKADFLKKNGIKSIIKPIFSIHYPRIFDENKMADRSELLEMEDTQNGYFPIKRQRKMIPGSLRAFWI